VSGFEEPSQHPSSQAPAGRASPSETETSSSGACSCEIPPSPTPRARQKQARILVVEDNPDVLRATQRILETHDYEVLSAMDGEAALSAAREELPDLILLDVMLPKMDGIEVLKQLKADPGTLGIMVILVTAKTSLSHRLEGFDAGADDYIPKPFQVPELLARIRCSLRIKRLTDDLAERNRQLVKNQKALVQSEKMATIGLLASGIAHEFNNIMAGISGYAQLARKDPKFRDVLVDVAMTQTERAIELTRGLSTYHKTAVECSACKMVDVIESALCLVAKELEGASLRLTKEFLEHPTINMSPGNFQEVALNLILNAIQAIEENSDGWVKVKVAPAAEAEKVIFEVSDSGIGIPESNLSRLFDPFFTTKGALGGGKRSGTGLGLTICYNVVQSHSGEIQVESELGKGSTFRVILPRSTAVDFPRADRLTPSATVEKRKLRILVVDDEESLREMIREYLSEHEVVCCSRGEAALEAQAVQPFDFVLLDVCVQGSLNGFQIFDRLSMFERPPKVIFASGRFPDEEYLGYIRRAHGHLLKPFKFESLLTLLGLPVSSPPVPVT
jgi:two-component system NtrC family sensor kinase